MDDIIDLELEKIECILEKIDSDPESMEVKGSERHLWEKIYHKSGLGRRTGVGTLRKAICWLPWDYAMARKKQLNSQKRYIRQLHWKLTVRQ